MIVQVAWPKILRQTILMSEMIIWKPGFNCFKALEDIRNQLICLCFILSVHWRLIRLTAVSILCLQARGIDIPMLDNVINYNFPAKAKLFIHRVGK